MMGLIPLVLSSQALKEGTSHGGMVLGEAGGDAQHLQPPWVSAGMAGVQHL